MSLKGTKIYSILTGVCPICHQESMYKEKNPYKLIRIFDMNERCSHCNTKYKIEPSFFFGAMYVSYAIGVAISFCVFLIAHYGFKTSLLGAFWSIVVALVVLMPIIIRLSRNIWINIYLHYDKNFAKNQ
ncbi:DUF983 domain-containing protein [Mesonia sp. K7]|uniref:DUF983 domain-containing protein n=1 Tax=Mesonia sp. K7 TaxID=2218606 RepID=UPI000DAABE46|nr:DUF983 domain-containing protein [Mesonia sp. K7]PZD78710.1 DUF983 domain-containing protein [Mesonia sp. K7]